MEEQRPKKRSRVKKGLAATATITVAAGLAAAALLYLRKRGIHPADEARKFKGRAKSAADILKGESKAAYQEMRATIVAELAESNEPITKPLVFRTIKEVLGALKKHGELTSKQLNLLGEELKTDWKSLLISAKRRKD